MLEPPCISMTASRLPGSAPGPPPRTRLASGGVQATPAQPITASTIHRSTIDLPLHPTRLIPAARPTLRIRPTLNARSNRPFPVLALAERYSPSSAISSIRCLRRPRSPSSPSTRAPAAEKIDAVASRSLGSLGSLGSP